MKVWFETLGCPKNFNDSQVAKGYLWSEGYQITENPSDADVIVINTCGFINDAKQESIERIFDMLAYKEQGKKIVVSGCLSERYVKELFEEIPEVDLYIGVNEYDQLPKLIENLQERKAVVTKSYAEVLPKFPRKLDEISYSATIKIAEGCDNCCAYCVIPSIRGKFRSKKMEDIISEAEELVTAGCRELILIAQDVTNYGMDLYGRLALPELLKNLCQIEDLHWIRLMYCYEDRITDELIEVMATEKKICHYIDIPVQHISDNILKSMKRRSSNQSIQKTIGKLRKAIPDIHIRTTLIVGFPGEMEDDFDQLLDFVEETKLERLGVFAYSQEENTIAAEMDNQISDEIKAERVDCIMRRQLDISLASNEQKIGKRLEVLVEELCEDGSYVGRTQYDAPEIDNSVLFTSDIPHHVGDFVEVVIVDAFDYDLVGKEEI